MLNSIKKIASKTVLPLSCLISFAGPVLKYDSYLESQKDSIVLATRADLCNCPRVRQKIERDIVSNLYTVKSLCGAGSYIVPVYVHYCVIEAKWDINGVFIPIDLGNLQILPLPKGCNQNTCESEEGRDQFLRDMCTSPGESGTPPKSVPIQNKQKSAGGDIYNLLWDIRSGREVDG